MLTMSIAEFCKDLPKVELHAHINGSASLATIRKLYIRNNLPVTPLPPKGTAPKKTNLTQVFNRFRMIHELCNSEEAVKIVTKDVVREFAEDNVKYVELRTTPREVASTGMTRERHMDTVIKTLQWANNSALDITTRLLVSIDRRTMSSVNALETVKMAAQLKTSSDGLVVGVDLSGNPKVGNAQDFLSAFSYAKNEGLNLALHLAEVSGYTQETEVMLGITPDRLGHGTFLHQDQGGSKKLVNLVKQYRIPIECCMTSNVLSQTVREYADHHFKFWYDLGHPVTLATDDKGVFGSDLSHEYELAAETFGLGEHQLYELSKASIGYAFCPEQEKQALVQRWRTWAAQRGALA